MGTSSARKAPVGKFWRPAKTAASRFASGRPASPLKVQEVVARYLRALQPPNSVANRQPTDFLPELVQTAAALGNFYQTWKEQGWEAALARLGLEPGAYHDRDAIIPVLLDRLAGPGASLAQAVSRAALIDHLVPVLSADQPRDRGEAALGPDAPEALVSHFLGLGLYRQWQSDLGEALEFHAPTLQQGVQRQEEIKSHILATLARLSLQAAPAQAFSTRQGATLLERLFAALSSRHEP